MLFRGLIGAIRTLSTIPLPGRDPQRLSDAVPWFPLVGLLLGGAVWGVAALFLLLSGGTWTAGAAAAAIVAVVILTGAMHLDGLADWADGFFGGGRDRARVLAIMKEPAVGAFGVIAVALLLLVKWIALARLFALDRYGWIVVAMVVSRTVQAALAIALPYARGEGGTAAPFTGAQGRTGRQVTVWGLSAVAAAALAGPAAGGLAVAAGAAFALLFGLLCVRRIGGITGDCLGAAGELSETLLLFSAAVPASLPAVFRGLL